MYKSVSAVGEPLVRLTDRPLVSLRSTGNNTLKEMPDRYQRLA